MTPGYPPARALVGWVLFDWACQPFFTLVTTFVFAPYFAAALAANAVEGQALWGYATAAAGLTLAVLSPVLGSIADASGPKKPWIALCGTVLALACTALWFAAPGASYAIPLALAAFAGSCGGAVVASFLHKEAFTPIILVVLVVVGAWTLWKPDIGQVQRMRFTGRRHMGAAALIGAVIGFYDGALGPGTGSFLVVALVGICGYAFVEASGLAKIANVATNLAALVVFLPQGAVMWRIGLVMGAANVLGGYLGARSAVALGPKFVRGVLLVVVGAFVVRLGGQLLHLW